VSVDAKDLEKRRTKAKALEKTIAPGADRTAIDEQLAGFVNLHGHDDDAGLPCLCRECLPSAGTTATSEGMTFYRSFALAGTRVLHFWMLADVARDRENVRRSVATALVQRLTTHPEPVAAKQPARRSSDDEDEY